MRWSGFMLTGVCGLAMTMPALAQSSAQPRPFTFHWGVTTWIDQIDIGNDWQRQVDFRGAPIQRDFVIIYQHFLGETPWGGPHVTSQPGYWTRHFAEIRRWLDFWCPDPNFSGLLSLEHEWVPFTWQGRSSNPQVNDPLAQDRDFGDDWYEHMLANRPDEIAGLSGVELELRLRDTYEAAMREWFERTHDEVRRLRPNAKIGWYGFPNFRNFDYHWPNNPASAENDRLAYIFERQDVAMPVVYLNRAVVSGRAPHPDTEIAAEDNDLLIASNIREARRLSPTKPLIVFTTPIYMETNPAFGGQWMSELAIRQTYEIPRREGADGAIIWWAIRDRRGFEDFDRFFAETLVDPISDAFVAPPEPQLPPSAPQNQAQAPAEGGSGEPSGGGSSGGGSSGGAAPSGGGSSGGSSSSSGSGSSGSSGGTGVNTFLPPPPPPQPQPSSPYQRAVAHLQNQQSSSGSTGGGSGSGGTSSGSSGTGSAGTGSTGSSGSGPEAGGSSGSSSSSAAARSAATRRNAATVRPSGAGVSRWMAPGSQRTAPAAGGRSGSSTGGSQATTPPRGNRVNVSAQDALRRMRQPVAPARPPSNRMSAMTTPANPRPQQRP